jgi:hypothetical protein
MKRKTSIVGGIILILLGLLFLASEILPDYFQFWDWPFIIIGLGVVFFIWAIISGNGGLAVPGAILSGIGGIFYYQNMSGDWASWSFIWALIPGFVGIGVIISGIIDRNYKEAFSGGLTLIIISAILFFAFGSFLGLESNLSQYWPVLLIALGLISLVRALFSSKWKRS